MKKILLGIMLVTYSICGKAQEALLIKNNTCEGISFDLLMDAHGCDNGLISTYHYGIGPYSSISFGLWGMVYGTTPGGPLYPPGTVPSAWSGIIISFCGITTATVGDACGGLPTTLTVPNCSDLCPGTSTVTWSKDADGNVTVTINP